ncbi:hypothetical protein MMPV_001780 [Pyropia vietnamensis]
MGLPKESWLALLKNAASHHSLPCLSEGLRHAVYARQSDNIYDGDGDDNSRAWAAEAIEHYELAASALCTAAGAASAAALRCVCAELVARSDEAAARAAALRTELDHGSSGCCCTGTHPPAKKNPEWCTWEKKKEKEKCMCPVCVADRKGDECTCSSGASACEGGAACTMVCVEAQPVVCATPAYACWSWYRC